MIPMATSQKMPMPQWWREIHPRLELLIAKAKELARQERIKVSNAHERD